MPAFGRKPAKSEFIPLGSGVVSPNQERKRDYGAMMGIKNPAPTPLGQPQPTWSGGQFNPKERRPQGQRW